MQELTIKQNSFHCHETTKTQQIFAEKGRERSGFVVRQITKSSRAIVDKVYRKSSVYLIISTEASDDVTGFRDKQKVVHALQGHVADAVTATVSALGLARVVRTLLRAAFDLRGQRNNNRRVHDLALCDQVVFVSCGTRVELLLGFSSKLLAVLSSFSCQLAPFFRSIRWLRRGGRFKLFWDRTHEDREKRTW